MNDLPHCTVSSYLTIGILTKFIIRRVLRISKIKMPLVLYNEAKIRLIVIHLFCVICYTNVVTKHHNADEIDHVPFKTCPARFQISRFLYIYMDF